MSQGGWSLEADHELLERYMPGLRDDLSEYELKDLERPQSPGIDAFKKAKGAVLLVPSEHKGSGASAVDAVKVQRAVGSLAPSLAVASTMHHFSVASLMEMATGAEAGLEWMMLQAIAEHDFLVASGFAEGKTGQHVFRPTMKGRRTADGVVIDGVKKPCSLTWSMDLLTASVLVCEDGKPDQIAVAMIPAETPGIERHPFWGSNVLAGAESDEIVLSEVHVPDRLLVFPEHREFTRDERHARGFIWFEALISASYLGIASSLAGRVLDSRKGSAAERVDLAVEIEGARYALLCLAAALDSENPADANLAEALLVRYSVQRAVMRIASAAAECVGGLQFISGPDVAYLLAASRALGYHPPSYGSAIASLDDCLGGAELVLE
jgi:alkylation response protein AidB-like acyl-CoA dehydrogenase